MKKIFLAVLAIAIITSASFVCATGDRPDSRNLRPTVQMEVNTFNYGDAKGDNVKMALGHQYYVSKIYGDPAAGTGGKLELLGAGLNQVEGPGYQNTWQKTYNMIQVIEKPAGCYGYCN